MRLWHQALITKLPRMQLLGQHRECCALRGNGWGKKHSVINYVFNYHYGRLVAYHWLIMNEMKRRGFIPEERWYLTSYRGKQCNVRVNTCITAVKCYVENNWLIFPEHNDEYLKECLENLKNKGIYLDI